LNEIGKLFERIIVSRLDEHLRVTSGLSDLQYGFRAGRSTIGAIGKVKEIVTTETERERVIIAISLDVKNAFNTIPWGTIRSAMNSLEFPIYLRGIVSAYLTDRRLVFVDCDGVVNRRSVSCGVPQGLALGPVLWNIAYNSVLRLTLRGSAWVVGYADDTVILASGEDFGEAVYNANHAAILIVREIERLGLEISTEKTQVMCFPSCATPDRGGRLFLKGKEIVTSCAIKYLGLYLDGDLNFEAHFTRVAEKVNGIIRLLNGVLPNCRGPSEKKRKLYLNVVFSVILYGSPVWHGKFRESVKSKMVVNRLMRRITQRVCCAYRTVSYVASMLLTSTPPVEITADRLARVYRLVSEMRARGEDITPVARARISRDVARSALDEWMEYLDTLQFGRSGRRVYEALHASALDWSRRGHGNLTFHMTQILSGHGVFNDFFYLELTRWTLRGARIVRTHWTVHSTP